MQAGHESSSSLQSSRLKVEVRVHEPAALDRLSLAQFQGRGKTGTIAHDRVELAAFPAGIDARRQTVEKMQGVSPKARDVNFTPSAASIYFSQPYTQDNSFLIVGERVNASGSKKMRDLLQAEDWDGLIKLAKEQERDRAARRGLAHGATDAPACARSHAPMSSGRSISCQRAAAGGTTAWTTSARASAATTAW